MASATKSSRANSWWLRQSRGAPLHTTPLLKKWTKLLLWSILTDQAVQGKSFSYKYFNPFIKKAEGGYDSAVLCFFDAAFNF
ncbi:hypothetical protein [Acutalibacter sp. 1XD8-33]|uniref:hypothetical protein n=1 Tax=Acutalibacter sp. 1XD8-33 TaxID=2320081 RepID=UPI0011C417F9|nr:hypothetical protein [Acutalibacter sp. 1XD8-33]